MRSDCARQISLESAIAHTQLTSKVWGSNPNPMRP